jgi:hypothetical protein
MATLLAPSTTVGVSVVVKMPLRTSNLDSISSRVVSSQDVFTPSHRLQMVGVPTPLVLAGVV